MRKREGSIKEGERSRMEEFGCHCIVIWIFRYTLEGLHLSHRPSTSRCLSASCVGSIT